MVFPSVEQAGLTRYSTHNVLSNGYPGPPDLLQAKLDPYYRLTGLGIMREPLSLIVARISNHRHHTIYLTSG